MSGEIRLLNEKDYERFLGIVGGAFPGISVATEEDKNRWIKRLQEINADPKRDTYGLYRDGKLLGGMILYDFTMNMRSILIPAGGIGLVVVDLLHKKESVAKKMLTFFIDHYRRKKAPILLLYPFRSDFYKKMGFGYGPKMNQYRILPSSFPKGPSKTHITYLSARDKEAILACYNRYAARTHGMVVGSDRDLDPLFDNEAIRLVGYKEGEQIAGFLAFEFIEGAPFQQNDLEIRLMVYENREVLSEMSTFLHSQLDQVPRVVFNTFDNRFHHLLADPRNDSARVISPVYHESNAQAVGLMYRVSDVTTLFAALQQHNFGRQTCRLRIDLTDTFCAVNDGSTILHFEDGQVTLNREGYDVTIRLDISEFSSMVMGCISFRKLYEYSLAEISDTTYLDVINQLFYAEETPMCLTRF